MRRDVFVYLSGPITPKNGFSAEENVASALKVYLECVRLGYPAYCPHLSAAFPSSTEVSYDTWMALDFVILERCTHMVMLPRWESSFGARAEMAYATEKGIPALFSLLSLVQRLNAEAITV